MKKKTFPRIPEKFKRPLCKWSCKGHSILLGSLLSVNLILEVKGGSFYLKRKFVKSKNVENILKMNLKKLPKVLHMFHANDKDGAEEWIADIRQAFPEMDFKLYPLPISFAVHAGEGTIAISY